MHTFTSGRYHIEKCDVLLDARRTARLRNLTLTSINGLPVEEVFFKDQKCFFPKPSKVTGFVMSNTVAMDDPNYVPSREDIKRGVITGRKGYVRCVSCNAEVFAPNARAHSMACRSA